ncbi:MAG: right-handed parallel beta-helix repeat-containing protein, partial [Planctomycetes bacterium]|nr:right-handed parallel beta-helix repeat-containing protein [Planctomycetota bacterium]
MKSQIVGIILFSFILVFVISFGNPPVIKKSSASVSYPKMAEYEELTSVLGTAYYVQPNGNDSNTGTGTGNGEAWATLVYAVSQVAPGDVVYVKVGTYTEQVTVTNTESGEAGLPIQFIADADGSVFGTSGDVTIDGTTYCIYMNGGDYWTFKDFKLTGCTDHGVYALGDSHHNTFEGLEIIGIGTGGTFAAIYLYGTSSSVNTRYTDIINCDITGDTFGIYLYNYSDYCEISENTIAGFTTAGIYISNYCDSCEISKCKISNSTNTAYGIYVEDSDSCSFENNFVYGDFTTAAIYDEDNVSILWNFNSVLNNESDAGNNNYGYHGKRGTSKVVSSFRNNIVEVSDTSSCYVMYIEGTGSNWLPTNLDNNLYNGGSSVGFYNNASCTFTEWKSETGKDTNSLNSDPQYTNSTNLYLQPDSPCLGKGTTITDVTEDIDGDERNTDGHPCIGADEMQTLEVDGTVTIDWDLTIGNITVESGGVLTISDGANIESGDVDVESGGTITFDGTSSEVFLSSSGHFNVQSGSTANIKGKVTIRAKRGTISSILNGEGEAGANGSGAGTDIDTTSEYSPSGAGHGGTGGAGIGTSGGSSYGDIIDPFEIGSKGGDVKTSETVNATGGAGGAALRLFISGTLTISSAIDMDGTDGETFEPKSSWSSGGGSGGSVFISAGIITGNGAISADGGDAPAADIQGGGGAGGRITIYSGKESSWTSTVSVTGGSGLNSGSNGTYLKHQVEKDNGICLNCGVSSSTKDSAFSSIESSNQTNSWIHTSATGGLGIEQRLIGLSGPGPNAGVSIYYNSNEASTIPSSLRVLGVGWNHTFNQYLIVNDDEQGDRDTVSWHRPCGQRFTFWDVDGDETQDYSCIPVYGLNSDAIYDSTLTGGSATIIATSGDIPGRDYEGWKMITRFKTYYFKDFASISGQSVALLDTIVDNYDRRITLEYTSNQLTYVQDSLDQSNDNTNWRRIYFTYTDDVITKFDAKYWVSSGTQITGKERNIAYNDSDLLETAGVSTTDWHWKYTYDGNNITKRDLWNDSESTGYYIEYAYTSSRVTSSKVGGEDIYMQYSYTDATGKVEIDGRRYDDSNRQEWF